MQSRSWIAWVAGAAVLAWSTVAVVQEPLVTFSNIFDVVPGRFFDANPKFTKPDPDNGNKLLIGFSPGFDATTFTVNEFTASTAAFYHAFAMDTISFLIEAPKDYYIARIIYTQTGTYTVSRTARAAVGVHWVVDGLPADLGRDEKTNFGLINTDPNLSSMIDLTGQNKSRVQVSITCSLFAFAPPMVTSATISIKSAEVLVELYPLSYTPRGSEPRPPCVMTSASGAARASVNAREARWQEPLLQALVPEEGPGAAWERNAVPSGYTAVTRHDQTFP